MPFEWSVIWCFHGFVEIVIGQVIQCDVPCLSIQKPVHLSCENGQQVPDVPHTFWDAPGKDMPLLLIHKTGI